jgi:hypothetical protein
MGADMHKLDKAGFSPFHYALKASNDKSKNSSEIHPLIKEDLLTLHLFISKGVNVDVETSSGQTGLHMSAIMV